MFADPTTDGFVTSHQCMSRTSDKYWRVVTTAYWFLRRQGEFLAVVCSSAIPMQLFFFQFHYKSLLNYNCNLETDFNLSMRFIDLICAEQEYRDVILFMTRSTFTFCHL